MLTRAIRSVLQQTFRDFELVVVNDASPDNTANVLAAIADPQVRTVELDHNSGLPAARNAGIAIARGEWVAFLDDDDEWLPGKLEAQLERVDTSSDPRTSGVYSLFAVRTREGLVPSRRTPPFPEGQVLEHIFTNGIPIVPSVFMVRRGALFDIGGFDESLVHGEDRDCWLRLAQAGHHFVAAPAMLAVYHEDHKGRLSDDGVASLKSLIAFRRRWGETAREALGPEQYAEVLRGRRRTLERLHGKFLTRLSRKGRRQEAWRYAKAMSALVLSEPWTVPFAVRALAIALFGRGAGRVGRAGRSAESTAYLRLRARREDSA
jgi:glycosyltransferase involved in cell wall biosynthesis